MTNANGRYLACHWDVLTPEGNGGDVEANIFGPGVCGWKWVRAGVVG